MLRQCPNINDIITGDRFAEIADIEINMAASGVKTARNVESLGRKSSIIFCKTDFVKNLFVEMNDCDYPCVLISHNSDYPITQEVYDSAPSCIKRWFALNVAYKVSDLIPIPSGMERPNGGGYSSDLSKIKKEWSECHERTNGIFACMNINNNTKERAPVIEHFKTNKQFVYRDYGTSHEEFLAYCASNRYVLSPPGNGIDCHRTWEALYMGAIPIVKRTAHTDGLCDLPMLITENWDIIDDYLLDMIYNGFTENKFNYEKMSMNYWKDRIKKEFEAVQ